MSESVTIIILYPEGRKLNVQCNKDESLLAALSRQGIYLSADCGGRGTCGKCRLLAVGGSLGITLQDRKLFSEEELKQGFRLSCSAFPKEDCIIRIPDLKEDNYAVVTEHKLTDNSSSYNNAAGGQKASSLKEADVYKGSRTINDSYIIAIDLGTTTLAFSLIDKASGKTISTHTAINHQRTYGADVISRIKASDEGKRETLKNIIRKEICEGILTVAGSVGISLSDIACAAISGNTTMGHLFMGYSCETLGVYPFKPVNIDEIKLTLRDISDEMPDIPVVIIPGISAFVGGDIVSGLLACGFDKLTEPCLFIDLGTNGEMAIGGRDNIMVTSTAAGPAFEGGNISYGTGSIPGAISSITIGKSSTSYRTIGGKPPVGFCGTGIIELAAELYKEGLMDATGLLTDPYFDEGYKVEGLTFTQKDIRELQMAKAAVRSGIELLIRRYGITYGQLGKVYLAGGFGYSMDIDKAVSIGLFPMELKNKITAVGNSSLAGAAMYLTDEEAGSKVSRIISIAKEIHLSNDPEFNDLYIECMSFGENADLL